MKLVKILTLILGVLIAISGLYCVFYPGLTYLGIGYVIGVSMLLDAIGRFHAWWQFKESGEADGWMLTGAILSAVFGIILISNNAAQLSVDVFIAYMIGIWIMTHAVITIIRAFRARKLHKKLNTIFVGKHWWLGLITGCAMCVFAVLSLMNPTVIMTAIGTFIGLGVIVAGANLISVGVNIEAK